MAEIVKNGVKFSIISDNWSMNRRIQDGSWEDYTFTILDRFSDKSKVYLDIGAWIGPTVLYASQKYKKVYGFEPDPVALKHLKINLSANNFENVTIIDKGLSNKSGTIKFGGNGELGNSESTMLVNDTEFLEDGGEKQYGNETYRSSDIVEVPMTTINDFIKEYNVDMTDIALVKMDIEGGESVVVPAMKNVLETYKPPFYISLHWVFLKLPKIVNILDVLFSIYDYCYEETLQKQVTCQEIIANKLETLVFTSSPIQ